MNEDEGLICNHDSARSVVLLLSRMIRAYFVF